MLPDDSCTAISAAINAVQYGMIARIIHCTMNAAQYCNRSVSLRRLVNDNLGKIILCEQLSIVHSQPQTSSIVKMNQ